MEEIPARRLDRRIQHRPAGLDRRQRHARRETAHWLSRRHAGHRGRDQARGRGPAHHRQCRPEPRPVQCLLRAQRRAAIREPQGSGRLAERKIGRHSDRQLRRPFRSRRLRKGACDAGQLSQPEPRSHHQRLPRRQARRRGDLGADRLAPGRRGPRPPGRDRQQFRRARRRLPRHARRSHQAAARTS